MPTTRRTTRSSTGSSSKSAAGGKQQTLSFKHKVTKAIKTGKGAYKSPARAKEYIPEPSPVRSFVDDDDDSSVPASPTPGRGSKMPTVVAVSDDDCLLGEEVGGEEEAWLGQQQQERSEEKSDVEQQAARLSDAAIERYWSGIESGRSARAVHRKHGEGLSTGEKVLRYFDVSSQYGGKLIDDQPCIGITRLKRWQRAQRLGLNPPVEVLAVLLKEDEKGNKKMERAHMDELLNSTAVGSVGV
ncbi:hypothetical protein N0V88_000159 [Collariella sp. IMI 366227]|nr:hypothetical protein N0V88_000159 [Collariella sp. IMI 366227]